MKHEYKFKQLILSMVFPLIILLLCIFLLVMMFLFEDPYSGLQGLGCFKYACFVSMLCGGVTPIAITIIKKVDTSRFFLSRVCGLLCISFLFVVAVFLSSFVMVWVLPWIVLGISLLFSTLYYIRKVNRRVEMIVIFLSNPLLYFVMLLLAFWYEINN